MDGVSASLRRNASQRLVGVAQSTFLIDVGVVEPESIGGTRHLRTVLSQLAEKISRPSGL